MTPLPFPATQRWLQQHATALSGALLVLIMSISLAWQTADWLRLLRAPAVAPSVQTAQLTVNGASHSLAQLFGATTSDRTAALPTSLRLTLLGSFVHADPARSSAIIGDADNQPQRYSIDGEISHGARLNAVHADHVELLRNGQREMLAFPRRQPEQLLQTPAQPAADTPSQFDEPQNDNLTQLHERMDALRQQMEASGSLPSDVETPDQTTESN
ncbi:type II secretion system protein N [Pseudomonas sp. SA3-5]|uniref:Type II secretion system protein N n=1 Tax=Pseudomonas aestuarii TaxID=3018340 RepID=A0ABT4XCG0_9PSED|nr:type II secretion system protein N [Pseudomonas aestuarii]MDA7085874.1 type II secretion system protein N [Pseudomonas aestuarii]